MGTAGWVFFILFAHPVKAHNNMCLVYTKFNALSYGYIFLGGGPIALHGLVHFLNTTGPSLTKVVYVHFDRISYKEFGTGVRDDMHKFVDGYNYICTLMHMYYTR